MSSSRKPSLSSPAAAEIPRRLTLLQPEPHILLAGIDGIGGLSTHIAEMGAQQRPPAEVDSHVHMQMLRGPHLLSLPHSPWVFL